MKQVYSFTISYSDLEITPSELLEASGKFEGDHADLLLGIATQIVSRGEELAHIEAAIVVYPIRIAGDYVWSEGVQLTPGKKITNLWKSATHGAFFVCTAGKGFEEASHYEMASGDVLKGYYIDLLGSLTVEKAMDRFQEEFKEELAQEGFHISNRYSPGYCDWAVADQFNLFQLMQGNQCGVTLGPSALMSPIKSISGIIAVGEMVKFRDHHCDLCNSSTCIYRNIKNNPR